MPNNTPTPPTPATRNIPSDFTDTPVAGPIDRSAPWSSVVFGPTSELIPIEDKRFVAFAQNSNTLSTWSGKDTEAWVKHDLPTLPSGKKWLSIAVSDTLFLAMGIGFYSTSTNGSTWSTPSALPSTSPGDLYWLSVSYGSDNATPIPTKKFVCVTPGSDKVLVGTVNGNAINWQIYNKSLPKPYNWQSITCGTIGANSAFVAVALGTNIAAYSINGGLTWLETTLPDISGNYGFWSAIAYGETTTTATPSTTTKTFIILGLNSTYVAVSRVNAANELSWELKPIGPSSIWYSIAFGLGNFMVISQSPPSLYKSTDSGNNWAALGTLDATLDCRSICFGLIKNPNDTELSVHNQGVFVMVANGTNSFTKAVEVLPPTPVNPPTPAPPSEP